MAVAVAVAVVALVARSHMSAIYPPRHVLTAR